MDYIVKILLAVFGGMTLVQLAPIKIDPWKWLFGWIGRAINSEVLERVGKMESRLEKLDGKVDESEAKAARVRILRFGDEVLHKRKHSKEHFDQVLLDIAEYEQYCNDHKDFQNGVTPATSKHIKKVYAERLENNDFL